MSEEAAVPCVLYVEDDRINTILLQENLRAVLPECRLVCVESGAEALATSGCSMSLATASKVRNAVERVVNSHPAQRVSRVVGAAEGMGNVVDSRVGSSEVAASSGRQRHDKRAGFTSTSSGRILSAASNPSNPLGFGPRHSQTQALGLPPKSSLLFERMR